MSTDGTTTELAGSSDLVVRREVRLEMRDFDKNGTLDIAEVYSDPAQPQNAGFPWTSVDVFLSKHSTTAFIGGDNLGLYQQRYHQWIGYWLGANQKMYAMDMNNDGRLDIGSSFGQLLPSGETGIMGSRQRAPRRTRVRQTRSQQPTVRREPKNTPQGGGDREAGSGTREMGVKERE